MIVTQDLVNKSIFSLTPGDLAAFQGQRRVAKFSQNGKFGQIGKLGHSCVRYHVIVHLGLNVGSSAHNFGCVVNGGNAMAAI